jgi:hypothetical protein
MVHVCAEFQVLQFASASKHSNTQDLMCKLLQNPRSNLRVLAVCILPCQRRPLHLKTAADISKLSVSTTDLLQELLPEDSPRVGVHCFCCCGEQLAVALPSEAYLAQPRRKLSCESVMLLECQNDEVATCANKHVTAAAVFDHILNLRLTGEEWYHFKFIL